MSQPPAFQFYAADFLSDANVASMTYEERGVYITLLCYCWNEGSVPCRLADLRRLLRIDARRFAAVWPAVQRCFLESNGRLTQSRLERERAKQAEFRSTQAEKGRASGRARGNPGSTVVQPGFTSGSCSVGTHGEPEGNSSSSISDLRSSVSDLQSSTRRVPAPLKSSSQQTGRLFFHRWQIDALIDTLGPVSEIFDLDAWLDDLSRTSAVLPASKDARWTWVQAELNAEVRRRGLPIAVVPAGPSSDTTDIAGVEAYLRRTGGL